MVAITITESKGLKDFIKKHEGFSSKPYEDSTGKLTVGYGDTNVDMNRDYSEDESEIILSGRLGELSKDINSKITREDLSESQQTAIMDMGYNIGTGTLAKNGFFDLVNSGDDEAVARKIREYTKARNKETKQLEDLPGLVRRSGERAEMYESGIEKIDDRVISDILAEEDAAQAQDDFDLAALDTGEEPEQEPIDLGAEIEEFDQTTDYGPNPLKFSQDISSDEETDTEQEARNLSKKLNIPVEEAAARLVDDSEQDITIEKERDDIRENFPVATKWASNPKNFPILKKDTAAIKNVEKASVSFSKVISDLTIAAKGNIYSLTEQKAVLEYESGLISQAEFINTLKETALEQSKDPKYNSAAQMKLISESIDKLGIELGDNFEDMNDAVTMDDIDYDNVLPMLSKLYAEGEDSVNSVLEFADAIRKNYQGAMVLSTQSLSSMVMPFVTAQLGRAGGAAIGFGAGLVGSPVPGSAAVGLAAGAFIGGSAVGYTLEFMQELKDSADPKTGRIDYAKFLNDPVRMERLRKRSAAYGVVSGSVDMVTQGLAGRFVEKPLKALLTAVGKGGLVGKGVKFTGGLALDVGVQTAGEFVQETSSATAADVAVGELTVKKLGKNVAGGFGDAALAIPSGGMISLGGASINIAVKGYQKADINRRVLTKLADTADKVKEAASNFNKMKGMRDALDSDVLKKYPEQTSEFVKDTLDSQNQKVKTEDNIPADGDNVMPSEQEIETESQIISETVDDVSAISAEDWDAVFTAQDMNPDEIAKQFGEDIYQDYKRAREDGGSFEAPIDQWLKVTRDHPELDSLARLNGAELSPIEAEVTAEYIDDTIENNMDTLFDVEPPNPRSTQTEGFKKIQSRALEVESKLSDTELMDHKAILGDITETLNAIGDSLNDQGENLSIGDLLGFNDILFAINDDYLGLLTPATDISRSKSEFASVKRERQEVKNFSKRLEHIADTILGNKRDKLEGSKKDTLFDVEPPPIPDQEISDIPVLPGQKPEGGPTFAQDVPEGILDEPVLRRVELYNKFKDAAHQEAFNTILKDMRFSTKKLKGVTQEAADVMAEIQFRHTRSRARMLGMDITEAVSKFRIRPMSDQQRVSTPKATGVFVLSPNTIEAWHIMFREDATIKTVVHEFGHSWLHEMAQDHKLIQDIAEDQLTAEQREYKEAMAIMTEKFNVDLATLNDGTIDNNEYRRIHESFAQTSEMYFLNGTFKDSRIQALMETFRKWMTKIADIVGKSYPQFPPVKIGKDIERLFQTLMDANNKIEEVLPPMFPDQMFPEGSLGLETDRYEETLRETMDQAIGETYAKMFNQTDRERDALINASLVSIMNDATAEVDLRRSMIMLKVFQDAAKAKKEGRVESEPRISFESFAQVVANGDQKMASKLKKGINPIFISGKKKGGSDIRQVMELFQINDPMILLGMMTEASQRGEIIEARADEIISQRFPDIKTNEDLHKIAVDAVQNKGKDKLLKMQLKILAEKHLVDLRRITEKAMLPPEMTTKMSKESILGEATRIVSEARALKFKPDMFLKNSGKHGREAAKLFYRGDFQGAFNSKRKEAIHFNAYKMARNTLKDLARVRAMFKKTLKFSDKNLGANHDVDVVGFARQLILTLQAGQTALPKFDPTGFLNEHAFSPETISSINSQLESFKDYMAGRSVQDTPVQAFLRLGAIVSGFLKMARTVKSLELEGRKIVTENAVIEIETEIGPRRKGDPTSRSRVIGHAINIRTFLSALMTEEEFAKSTTLKFLNKAFDAEAKYNIEHDVDMGKLTKAIRKLSKRSKGLKAVWGPLTEHILLTKSGDVGADPIASPELNMTFKNKGEVIMSQLLMGSVSGAEKFLIGGRDVDRHKPLVDLTTWITDGVLDESPMEAFTARMIEEKILTKDDFDLMQVVWSAFERHHAPVKETMRYTDGFEVGHIDARLVKTPWGEYTGGYVPLSRDEAIVLQKDAEISMSVDQQGVRVMDMYPGVNVGTTKQRIPTFKPVSLELSRLNNQLATIAKIAYLRKPMWDVGKAFAHPIFVQALEARRPGAMKTNVAPWYNRVMMQQYTTPTNDPINKIAKHIRKNAYINMFLANEMPVIKQIIGLVPGSTAVGKANIVRETKKATLGGPSHHKSRMDDISSKSIQMKHRFINQEANRIRSFEELNQNYNWLIKAQDVSEKMAFLPMQILQTVADVAIWDAGYAKAIRKGWTEKQAVDFASGAVIDTQSSSNVSSMSNLFHGSDLKRMFTMLTSVQFAMFGLNYKAAMRIDGGIEFSPNDGDGGGGDPSKVPLSVRRAQAYTGSALFTLLAPALLTAALVGAKASLFSDDDDDEIAEDMALSIGSEIVGGAIPIVGNLAGAVLGLNPHGSDVSPLSGQLSKVVTAGNALRRRTLQGVDINPYELQSMLNSLTLMLGGYAPIIVKGLKITEGLKSKSAKRRAKRTRRNQLKKARR